MYTPHSNLKAGDVLYRKSYHNEQIIEDCPKPIKAALQKMCLKLTPLGISGVALFCNDCGLKMAYTTEDSPGAIQTHTNGSFRAQQLGEDAHYMDGHYYKKVYTENPPGRCMACGKSVIAGYGTEYEITIDEINSYCYPYALKVFEILDVVVTHDGATGKIVGIADGRPQYARYSVRFDKHTVREYTYWQLRKATE